MDRAVFIIVDMLNRGSSLIDDQTQKYEVAQLNLRAGETSLMTSAFQSAVKYLMRGISLLDSNSWEDMYELTIKLYDAGKCAHFHLFSFSVNGTMLTCTMISPSLTPSQLQRRYSSRVNSLCYQQLARNHLFMRGHLRINWIYTTMLWGLSQVCVCLPPRVIMNLLALYIKKF